MLTQLEDLEASADAEAAVVEARVPVRYRALAARPCAYVGCVTQRRPGQAGLQTTPCPHCRAASYCSEVCEGADWRHAHVCGTLAAAP